jgi:hypothetical protein
MKCGDFRSVSQTATDFLDTLLVLIPVIGWYLIPTILVSVLLIISTALVNLGMVFVQDPRSMYGLRFLVPIITAIVGSACMVYTGTPAISMNDPHFIALSDICLSVVSTVCLADFGFHVNACMRKSFDRIYQNYPLLIVYQCIFVIACMACLYESMKFLDFDWVYCLVTAGIVILAVWDFDTKNCQRGSIMSATILVGGAITIGINPEFGYIPICIAGVYNNVFLNPREDRSEKSELPLLSPSSSSSGERFKFFLNFLLSVAQLSSLVTGGPTDPQISIITSYTIYVWIVIAPVVLSDRIFTYLD